MSDAPTAELEVRPPGVRPLLVLASSTGGVGRHVAALVAGLVERGATVTVAGPAATDELFGFSTLGAKFVAVEIAAEPRPVSDAAAVRALAAAAAAAESTVVHAHGLRAGAAAVLANKAAAATGAVAGVVGRGTGAPRRPLVVSLHNAILATGSKGKVLAGLELLVARGADVVLGASSDLVERARTLGANDARPGPVAAPVRHPSRDWAELRVELGATGRPLVLAVGRLAPQKDYPLLLSAAVSWSKLFPMPLVVIAGEGPLRGDLQARIDAGHLPVALLGAREDVPDLLAAADVVVLPSKWEARALIAQEALRAGTPLVATAVGGVPELVGNAAVLVPAGDVDALADAVTHLLSTPAAAGRLAAAGPVQAATWPDDGAIADGVLALYTELATTRRGAASGAAGG